MIWELSIRKNRTKDFVAIHLSFHLWSERTSSSNYLHLCSVDLDDSDSLKKAEIAHSYRLWWSNVWYLEDFKFIWAEVPDLHDTIPSSTFQNFSLDELVHSESSERKKRHAFLVYLATRWELRHEFFKKFCRITLTLLACSCLTKRSIFLSNRFKSYIDRGRSNTLPLKQSRILARESLTARNLSQRRAPLPTQVLVAIWSILSFALLRI